MKCPKCNTYTKVINSRYNNIKNLIRRRRECNKCGYRFSTEEIIVESKYSYEYCWEHGEYYNQDCKKCPYLKDCGGI